METYQLDTILKSFTVRDLPLNRRQQLASYLNSEQVLESESGLARDFRGIAQQLGLNYSDIVKLEKMIDPFGTLLSYNCANKIELFQLMRMIEHIGRFDILDDVVPVLVSDIKQNLINNQRKDELLYNNEDNLVKNHINSTIWYDAYVCYADSDLSFVRSLTEYLESAPIGLRLFVRDRDLLGGNWVYETFARLIESQCRRVLIILSPDFLLCPDCAFQSQLAASLGIEKRARILIPVIYKSCELPAMIRLLSKIDMSSCSSSSSNFYSTSVSPTSDHLMSNDWALNRLVRSLQNESFISLSPKAIQNDIPTFTRNSFPHSSFISSTSNSNIQKNPIQDGILLKQTIVHEPNKEATSLSIISTDSVATCAQRICLPEDDDERQLIEYPMQTKQSIHYDSLYDRKHHPSKHYLDKHQHRNHYSDKFNDPETFKLSQGGVKSHQASSQNMKDSKKSKTLLSTLRRKIKNIL